MLCTLMFLVAYAALVVFTPNRLMAIVLTLVMAVCWIAFAADYVIRLRLASNRRRWMVSHWLDLITVAVPLLRPVQLLKFLPKLGMLHMRSESAIRVRIVAYAATSVVLLLLVGSLSVLQVERGQAGSTIETFGNAMWWSIVTMTTVGYGDLSPVTIAGRVIAVMMMIGGIALIGVVTGTLASWIVSRVATEDAEQSAATRAELVEMQRKLDQVLRELRKANRK